MELNNIDVAQETVNNMQTILDSLREASEQYELPVTELFAALQEKQITEEGAARLYSMLKQLMLTISYVVTNEANPQQLVSNLFSLVVSNMLFYKGVSDYIPQDQAVDALIISSSLLFQLESASVDAAEVEDIPVMPESKIVVPEPAKIILPE